MTHASYINTCTWDQEKVVPSYNSKSKACTIFLKTYFMKLFQNNEFVVLQSKEQLKRVWTEFCEVGLPHSPNMGWTPSLVVILGLLLSTTGIQWQFWRTQDELNLLPVLLRQHAKQFLKLHSLSLTSEHYL